MADLHFVDGAVRHAEYYQRIDDGFVRCRLCWRGCEIAPGDTGVCGVRENREGRLHTLVYGLAATGLISPIERQRLFHLAPATQTLAVATVGCNLRCPYCQNWDMTQSPHDEIMNLPGSLFYPGEVVKQARQRGCRSISFTYTEPTVFYEYARDTARLAAAADLMTVFVTNGYIQSQPLEALLPYLTAVKVGLKSATEVVCARMTGGSLEPVLETLRQLRDSPVHVEVATPVIPSVNDSEQQVLALAECIYRELGPHTPWHLERFYPDYEFEHLPATPAETLHFARQVGLDVGLHHVYTMASAVDQGQNTYCPVCNLKVITRCAYEVLDNSLEDGACPRCGTAINGVQMATPGL